MGHGDAYFVLPQRTRKACGTVTSVKLVPQLRNKFFIHNESFGNFLKFLEIKFDCLKVKTRKVIDFSKEAVLISRLHCNL